MARAPKQEKLREKITELKREIAAAEETKKPLAELEKRADTLAAEDEKLHEQINKARDAALKRAGWDAAECERQVCLWAGFTEEDIEAQEHVVDNMRHGNLAKPFVTHARESIVKADPTHAKLKAREAKISDELHEIRQKVWRLKSRASNLQHHLREAQYELDKLQEASERRRTPKRKKDTGTVSAEDKARQVAARRKLKDTRLGGHFPTRKRPGPKSDFVYKNAYKNPNKKKRA